MDWFNNVAISALNKNLDGLWAREQVISENIANYETPNYKSKTVSFEDELLSQLQGASKSESKNDLIDKISGVDITESVSNDGTLREDGNNVDLEAQTIEMARTQLNYAYSAQNINEYFARLKTAING
ncbi:MAG: flagellar basal body rod protein FlgB [Anaerofustis sp.]